MKLRSEGVRRVLGERAPALVVVGTFTSYTLYTPKKIPRAAACGNNAARPAHDVTRAPSSHCEVMVYRVYRMNDGGAARASGVHPVHVVRAADPDRVPENRIGRCSHDLTGEPQHWARSASLAIRSCGLAAALDAADPWTQSRGKSTTTADLLPTRAEGRALKPLSLLSFDETGEFLREIREGRHE